MNLYKEIEKIFPEIENALSTEKIEEFKNMDEKELSDYHFGLGLWIRNTFIHPKDGLLHELSKSNFILEPDSLSSMVTRCFYYYLNQDKYCELLKNLVELKHDQGESYHKYANRFVRLLYKI